MMDRVTLNEQATELLRCTVDLLVTKRGSFVAASMLLESDHSTVSYAACVWTDVVRDRGWRLSDMTTNDEYIDTLLEAAQLIYEGWYD